MSDERHGDWDDVKARYAEERQKRLRADGVGQYRLLEGELAHLGADPYAPPVSREPLQAQNEVVIVGGGLAAIIIGAQLRKAGTTDVRIIEKGGDLGGVWYWNRYPGLSCDVESHIYIPMLEELDYVPTQRYASGQEIREKLQDIARKFDLYDQALLQTSVEGLRWDDARSQWMVSTDRGDEIEARYVIVALGSFGTPKLPDIKGIQDFEGHLFHTSRWDYDYTGGHEDGELVKLRDKHVAVVGTGATAVQCIPHLADWSGHLYVVQRTPAAVGHRGNAPTDPEWAASLKPGWQLERMRNFAEILDGLQPDQDLVADGWTATFALRNDGFIEERERRLGRSLTEEERLEAVEEADLQIMDQIRRRVDDVVQDPSVAASLKPWYKRWCKRPQFHDEYLEVFNRPNVTLIDTDGQGITSVEGREIVAGDERIAVDCIVMATGYDVGTEYLRRGGLEIRGRHGQSLNDKWRQGLRTLHGMHAHGFPNLLIAGPTQTGVAANYTYSYLGQAEHISYIIEKIRRSPYAVFEASQQAEDDWAQEMARSARAKKYFEDCTPGYITNEGDLDDPNIILNNRYGKGAVAFLDHLAEWRATGEMPGLTLS